MPSVHRLHQIAIEIVKNFYLEKNPHSETTYILRSIDASKFIFCRGIDIWLIQIRNSRKFLFFVATENIGGERFCLTDLTDRLSTLYPTITYLDTQKNFIVSIVSMD